MMIRKKLFLVKKPFFSKLHFISLILLGFNFFINKYTIYSILDYNWIRSLILFYIFSGILIYFIIDYSTFSKWENFYFRTMAYIPAMVFGIFSIPILGLLLMSSTYERFNNNNIILMYDDLKIRIESDFSLCPMGGCIDDASIRIYKKVLLFKKKLVDTDIMALDVSEIKVSYDPDSTRIIIYKTFDPNFSRTDTVSIAKD